MFANTYIQSPSNCDDEYGYICECEQSIEDAFKDGATAICKKILEEMENRALSGVSATTLRNIFKDLGIEL